MKGILATSFRQINSNLILFLIFLLPSLLWLSPLNLYSRIDTGGLRYPVQVILLCVIIYASCGVYASFYQRLIKAKVNFQIFNSLVKRYVKPCIAAGIGIMVFLFLFFLPCGIFIYASKGEMSFREFSALPKVFIIREVVTLIPVILTIYVLPFVFVKNRGINAVISGIKYLLMNFKKSAPLVLVGVARYIIGNGIYLIARRFPAESGEHVAIMCLYFVLSTYITLTIYVGACFILRDENLEEDG